MPLKKALCTVIAAVPPVIANAAASSADISFGFGFGGPCYDYDPYDRYHLYGKYYPYNRAHCGRLSHDDDVKKSAVRFLKVAPHFGWVPAGTTHRCQGWPGYYDSNEQQKVTTC